MTDREIVTKLAVEILGWKVEPYSSSEFLWFRVPGNPDCRAFHETLEGSFNPLTSISDARMIEDVIAGWPLPKRQKYINALFNEIVGSLVIVGIMNLYWGLIHATPRQRSMAALAAVTEGKNADKNPA